MASSALVERSTPAPGVELVTLNRPEVLNALTWPMIDELHAVLEDIGCSGSTRAVVVTGAGRGFCSGLDIGGDDPLGARSDNAAIYARQERVAALATALRDLPQPVLAAVNGPASGGGMALALAADIRVCAPLARFNVAFVRIGLSGCDVGVSYFLPRLVGLGMASELMLTGRPVDAEEAVSIGLANRVVGAGDLLDECLATAQMIARNSPFGVRMTKRVLGQNADAPSLMAAIELENRTQVVALRTDDAREALAAFTEGREPRFAPAAP
jgi:enoyl-CoA hydratase